MQTIQEGIRAAIDYIEAHLTDEMDVHDVAARAYVSAFHFQRIFTALCGMPLGEYVRCRRLTLAAQELTRGGKVIDAAMKYGYDSPDSFTRAFRRFHGVVPSQAGLPGVVLRSLAPMKSEDAPEARQKMEYRIETKEAFTVVGFTRHFHNETSYQEIPAWWDEMLQKGMPLDGVFGVCIDADGCEFDYIIADPYEAGQDVPEGCITRTIPGGVWAVFPCTLATLQDTNTRMWRDWLPACREYRLGGNYNVEYYFPLNQADPPSSPAELWLPIEPV